MLDRVERYLLCLGVFLAPITAVRPTEIAITYSDIVFALLAGLVLVRRRNSLAPMQDATILWIAAVLCLLGGLFASSILNGSPVRAIIVCAQYFFGLVLLPFILIRNDEETAILLVKVYVFACLFLAICGFIFTATGFTGGGVYITGAGRLASLSGNPNGFAAQIALTMPLFMYLWFSRSLSKIICLGIFAALGVALILTSSNGGLAMTSLAIAMFLLFTGKIRWLVQGAVLVVLAVTLVMTVGRDYLPEVFERRVLGTFESGDLDEAGTYEGRMALILEAVEWIDESLFLGIGVDQYRERSRFGAPVHNQYLIVWTEGGTIALVGWLLILGIIVVVGARGYQVPNGAPAAAATMSVATTLALVATSNTHMYGRTYIVPVLVIMGVTLAGRASLHAARSRYRPGGDPMTRPSPISDSSGGSTLPHRPAMHAQIHYGRRR